MTIFEVSVKIESIVEPIHNTYVRTFTSREGYYECWEQIDDFRKLKFKGDPTVTYVLNTADFDIHESNFQ
jgi:hypothetical protein